MNYELKNMNNKNAFTLFELLVSISIIGILVAVASMSYGTAQKKARDARRIQDMEAIQKAAEIYYSQNNYSYPTTTGAFVSSGVLQAWPIDPKGVGFTPAYIYTATGTTSYCACALVDNSTAGNSTTSACAFASSGAYFCVKNQQ